MITESPDQYFKAIHVEIYGVSSTYTNQDDESDEDLKPKNMNKKFSSVETQTE